MAGRAMLVETSKKHLTKEEKQVRGEVEEEWRRGSLTDYEPSTLTAESMAVFEVIACALPDDKVAKVDGYSIEIAANAIVQMEKANEEIEAHGLTVMRHTQYDSYQAPNPNIAIYKTYSDIAKRYLVELGCTPSARAKIAADAAKQITKPKGVYDLINDD